MTRSEILLQPVIPYSVARPELQTFDLGIWSGDYAFSRLIRYGTHSSASHASLLFCGNRRVMNWESVETQGCRFIPLSALLDGPYKYRGTCIILRPRFLITPHMVEAGMEHAWGRLGVPYPKWTIAVLAVRLAFGMKLNTPAVDGAICSEATARVYRYAGLPVSDAGEFGATTPSELQDDDLFEFRMRIL